MRPILFLAAVILLAGCSTVSAVRDAWRWDPTRTQERVRIVVSPDELATRANDVADLQSHRNDIRARIGAEADVRRRLALYEELHRVGRQLSLLERQRNAAGPAS